MNRSKTTFVLALLVLTTLFVVSSANAQDRRFTCTYDAETGVIAYAVIDGDAVEYSVNATSGGSVSVAATPTNLDGPDDNDTVGIAVSAEGQGWIQLEFCEGPVCFVQIILYFQADSDGQSGFILTNYHERVPTTTTWGLIILMALLIASGAYVARKRFAEKAR